MVEQLEPDAPFSSRILRVDTSLGSGCGGQNLPGPLISVMYERYFGLSSNPFSMTPDPALLYMTSSHREALAGLAYAIMERKGFVALTGEAGTGKTSLLARTLKVLPTNRVVSSVILNPSLTEAEFLELMLLDFGFQDVPESKAKRLLRFQAFLLQVKAAGQIAVVVVDEAHKLKPSVLEEIRLLSNLELPGEKLLQIVLAGQPELIDVLNRPDLRQLSQRISVRLTIDFLKPHEIEQYISLRWSKSGSTPVAFSPASYADIASWSRGIPRLVNSICDNALMLAFAETATMVDSRHVTEACKDLCLVDQEMKQYASLNGAAKPAAKDYNAEFEAAKAPAPASARVHVLESYAAPPKRSLWPRWMTRRAQ
jgi:general secretion pathway protein A